MPIQTLVLLPSLFVRRRCFGCEMFPVTALISLWSWKRSQKPHKHNSFCHLCEWECVAQWKHVERVSSQQTFHFRKRLFCWVGLLWFFFLWWVINKTSYSVSRRKMISCRYLKYLLFFYRPVNLQFWCSLGVFSWCQSNLSSSLSSRRFTLRAAGETNIISTHCNLKFYPKHLLSTEN